MKTVVIKNNDIIINEGAFDYCNKLQTQIKKPTINRYVHENGVIYNAADKSSSSENSSELYARANSFYKGLDVEQNYEEAFKLYLKAAQLGHVEAMNSLGVCYERGQGADQDYIEAAKWYRKAAERGYCPAQHKLGICYENGKGVDKNYAEAVKWYQLSAEQGYGPAQYNLGLCYSSGHGVKLDFDKAFDWVNKAAHQGVIEAIVALPSLKSLIKTLGYSPNMYKNSLDYNDIKAIAYYVEQGLDRGYSYSSPGLSTDFMSRLSFIIHVLSWFFWYWEEYGF